MSRLDILYCAWNRLRFTEASFRCLLRNTDWGLVDRLIVVDDGSEDGTRQYLDRAIDDAPVPHSLVHLGYRHPVRSMLCYLEDQEPAPWFVKVDNDIAMPPGWLEALVQVSDENPEIDLLGCEAGRTSSGIDFATAFNGHRDVEPARWIGGVGLMRTHAFMRTRIRLAPRAGRFGFTEWQQREQPDRPVCGWVTPDLAVLQLDRMPLQPWSRLSDEYIAAGWQRAWPRYHPLWMAWAWQWFLDQEPE